MRILALSSLWTVVPLYHLVIATFTRSDWDVAYQQARKTVASLSADEKATIVTGTGDDYRACTGSTKGLDRIGLPALCFNDGPAGVVYSTGVTSFPAGIHVAASWNEKLAYERAFAMGEEAKLLGVHALLGVEVGPLGKIPQAGRNWESE